MAIRPLAVATMAAIALIAAAPGTATTFVEGLAGGAIRGRIANERHRMLDCNIVVPDSFVVSDIDFAYNRVVVTASVEYAARGGADPWYLSEVWSFAPRDTAAELVSFEDRQVLASGQSAFGESIGIYQYAVSCYDATAVYRRGWEWGTVLLFDAQGRPLPLDTENLASVCGFSPDFVTPIAWVERDRQWRLILRASEYGGNGSRFVAYSLAGAMLEALGPDDLSGDLLEQLVAMALDQK